jgi:hypothetical protein
MGRTGRIGALAGIALALLLGGCGTAPQQVDDYDQAEEFRQQDDSYKVQAYCSYGAVSRAQLEGCIDHVSAAEALDYDTNAGAFARGELEECLADAGPFCETRP